MRLVFAGTPKAAVPSLQALLDSPHDVVAVVTRPDAPAGRGRGRVASAIAQLAADHGVETITPASTRDPAFADRLADIAPDCCPVVAYGGLLPKPLLDIPLRGWVNLHFSLLPAWRGAAPVQRALMAGDEVTGATTFRIVEELDAGPTYGLLTESIRPDDTAGTLLDRLAQHGGELLVATIDGIANGSLDEREQAIDGTSQAPKLRVAEAEVVWDKPAFAIDRLIRGCTPTPGAWTMCGDTRLKLGPVRMGLSTASLRPGELAVEKDSVTVGTGTAPVQLSAVQPPGKAQMTAADWARGMRAAPSRFGP